MFQNAASIQNEPVDGTSYLKKRPLLHRLGNKMLLGMAHQLLFFRVTTWQIEELPPLRSEHWGTGNPECHTPCFITTTGLLRAKHLLSFLDCTHIV